MLIARTDFSNSEWNGIISLGGLDLSRHGLDRDSRSRHKKKSVSTVEIFSTVQKPSLDSLDYSKNQDFSIFVEISIESLDLDSLKKDISTVEIFSTVWKTTSRRVDTPNLRDNAHLFGLIWTSSNKIADFIWTRSQGRGEC